MRLETCPFRVQTTRAYQLKKKKKQKQTQYYIKKISPLFREQKKPQKKKKRKKRSKNPKTQNVLPDQDSYLLSLQTLLYSFKHTDRPKKLTRIKFKFLKPHGAFRDMPLQSSDNTRLSIKKKIK